MSARGSSDAIGRSYSDALLAMTYIAQRYGVAKVRAFFTAAQGKAADMDRAFAVLGTTTAGFVSAWNAAWPA